MLPTKSKRRFPLFASGMPSWFETDRFFDDSFFDEEKSIPPMNIKEDEKTMNIELAIPGFSKDQIEVSLEDDLLQISALKEKEAQEDDVEGYTRKEFSSHAYERRVKLPSTVNKDKEVKATYKDGVLQLELEKTHEINDQSVKKIEIA